LVKTDKRSKLRASAVELAYRQGFRKTTIADLAEESKVPIGNIYYYFKTKDELGTAILDTRLEEFHRLRDFGETLGDPKARIGLFIDATLDSRAIVAERGCPMGSLCAELLKDGGALGERSNALFSEPMAWLAAQFRAIGQADGDGLALQLMASLQGVSLLAQSFRNPRLIETEAARLKDWLAAL
jgi:TetR/AcrR family transcriptional regulator, transcriptional repressor for nem operon